MEEDIQKLKQLSEMADKSKDLVESLKSLGFDFTTVDLAVYVHNSIMIEKNSLYNSITSL